MPPFGLSGPKTSLVSAQKARGAGSTEDPAPRCIKARRASSRTSLIWLRANERRPSCPRHRRCLRHWWSCPNRRAIRCLRVASRPVARLLGASHSVARHHATASRHATAPRPSCRLRWLFRDRSRNCSIHPYDFPFAYRLPCCAPSVELAKLLQFSLSWCEGTHDCLRSAFRSKKRLSDAVRVGKNPSVSAR